MNPRVDGSIPSSPIPFSLDAEPQTLGTLNAVLLSTRISPRVLTKFQLLLIVIFTVALVSKGAFLKVLNEML